MDMTPQTWPEWYDGRHINEVLFCQQFLDKHPMKCVRGRLFTVDGLIEDEGQIGNLILEEISGVLTSGLSKIVTNLLASIKLQAYSPPLSIETDRIHVANGTYFMDGSFTADKNYCNNRLTVAYNPDAPIPQKWLQFLSELLQPEDIPTLQEFLGYCLLPTTKGQKMLMLIGKGGEGKSRIGLVMRSLLGDSMNTTSIAFNKKRAAAPHCKPQHPEHKIGGKHDLYPLQLPRAGRKNGACNYRYRPLQRSGRSVCCCAGTVEPQV